MPLGQRQTGETVNATVSLNPTTGADVYSFINPFNMLLNLDTSSSITVRDGNTNNRINLLNASNVIIQGGLGNDIYNVSATAGGLNNNVIHGAGGDDFITLSGSNTSIDLTQGTTGIEAVVGHAGVSGESVTVMLNQLVGSTLTDGGTGRAFAAVIGSTGQVNVVETGTFHLVGVVDAAGHGFAGDGSSISGTALTSLLASVTSIDTIRGNLAAIWSLASAVPAHETHIADLNAYVFSNGNDTYTIWSDGTVTPTDNKGTVLSPIYQPAPATPSAPTVYGAVSVFDRSGDWAGADLTTDQNGVTHLSINDGSTSATAAIALKSSVTGTIIHGDAGNNGSDWFGLGDSGGLNHIYGSKGGNIFDLQQSIALQDVLIGGIGFDVVRAPAAAADVDLTANNAFTGQASTSIDAVVGSPNALNLQTVELDVNRLSYSLDSSGNKVGVFEALLGSTGDTVTFSGLGQWIEVTTFAPGAAPPAGASQLVDPAILDSTFGSLHHTAENSLTGYLFEQVDSHNNPLKYLTVYTDATLDSTLAAPLHVAAVSDHLI